MHLHGMITVVYCSCKKKNETENNIFQLTRQASAYRRRQHCIFRRRRQLYQYHYDKQAEVVPVRQPVADGAYPGRTVWRHSKDVHAHRKAVHRKYALYLSGRHTEAATHCFRL